VYKVARRYGLKVFVVANNSLLVPNDPLVELVVRTGFGAADDWIAEQIGPHDIAITSDIPLAARCVANRAVALDHKGRLFTADTIGEAVAQRNLMQELRITGEASGRPEAMTAARSGDKIRSPRRSTSVNDAWAVARARKYCLMHVD
jgi:uncharacterized protein YaiI (UPF0178 family)